MLGKQKYRADFIPPSLLIARYFSEEQKVLERLETDGNIIIQQMEELDEEHGGEEGILVDSMNDKGKVTKEGIKEQLAIIKRDPDALDEQKILSDYLSLIEKKAVAEKKLKHAQNELAARAVAQYGKLTEDEIKILVVEDKWLTALDTDIQTEMDYIAQILADRIKELAERYAIPLLAIEQEVENYKLKVENHLRKMGFDWQTATSKCGGVIA